MSTFSRSGAFLVLLCGFLTIAGKAATPEWTIMVFLNGDNNLELDALADFNEIAAVGSTDAVNVVVQFDRQDKVVDDEINWGTTLRYYVTKGMKPTLSSAVDRGREENMGEGRTLLEFIEWAQNKYPAKRYCLIIWNHGQGFRLFENYVRPKMRAQMAKRSITSRNVLAQITSVSVDYSDSDELYNREIADVLEQLPSGRKIDVLAFDACLMAMLESAYAFRDSATIMVGSEEEESAMGWAHDIWLSDLTHHPTMSPRQLGIALVDAFEKANKKIKNNVWTLSAVDLGKVNPLADATSELAKALIRVLDDPAELAKIDLARRACYTYGDHSHGIDLGYFCAQLEKVKAASAVVTAAALVKKTLGECAIDPRRGDERDNHYGSMGLAIYFPKNRTEFCDDNDHDGYLESNRLYPLKFVADHQWDNFLHAYYKKKP